MRLLVTFDGGGVRGLLALGWAAYLEQQLGAPLGRHVSVVAGTSVGAIAACATAWMMSMAAARGLVETSAARIFPRGLTRIRRRAIRAARSLATASAYDPAGLRAVLHEVFGDARFGALARRTLVVVKDATRHEGIVLDSRNPAHGVLSIVDVCCASAAAPTYFPCVPLELGGRTIAAVDGGMCQNNPALVAWMYDARDRGDADTYLVSFGTGRRTRPVTVAEGLAWGLFEWVTRGDLIGTFIDGPSEMTAELAHFFLPAHRYARAQADLEIADDEMDDASPANLAALASEEADALERRGLALTLDTVAQEVIATAGR